MENEPVLFVGVNAGNNVKHCQGYAKILKTNWAYYADTDESFQKKFLNLTKIERGYEYAGLIKADGTYHQINTDLESGLKAELPNTKWKIDPKDVPEVLKKAWRQFEFGQSNEASLVIKQALGASDPKVKECAAKMDTMLKEEVAKRLMDAEAKVAASKWAAYKAFEGVTLYYKAYPEVVKAATEMTKLKSDAQVVKELKAKFMLDKIQEWAHSPRKPDREMIKPGLAALAKDFADTEAGRAAETIDLIDKDKKTDATQKKTS